MGKRAAKQQSKSHVPLTTGNGCSTHRLALSLRASWPCLRGIITVQIAHRSILISFRFEPSGFREATGTFNSSQNNTRKHEAFCGLLTVNLSTGVNSSGENGRRERARWARTHALRSTARDGKPAVPGVFAGSGAATGHTETGQLAATRQVLLQRRFDLCSFSPCCPCRRRQ